MKKYISLITLGCLLSLPAFGADWTTEECQNKGGSLLTVGDQTFCKSTKTMNWWSAYSWCQGMSGYMPSIKELCPNASITSGAYCNTYPFVWSSTPINSNKVYAVIRNIVETGWDAQNKSNNSYMYAACLKN